MVSGFQNEVRKLLREHGWYQLPNHRGKGSHAFWAHADKQIKVTVPNKILSRHTANGILKDAGIDKKL